MGINKTDVILENKWANFFGIERIDTKGKTHSQLGAMRGNGNLCLTEKGIYFKRWIPKKEFFIPLEKIEKSTSEDSTILKQNFSRF